MIERQTAFKVSDGTLCATIEDAKRMELEILFENYQGETSRTSDELKAQPNPETVASLIMDLADQVADILTMNTKSRPKARKANGGTKKRSAQARVETHPVGWKEGTEA